MAGMAALLRDFDVSPLDLAEDIIAIRDTFNTATEPLTVLLSLLEGVNIESAVTQFLSTLLGVEETTLKQSPIIALITEQAKMVDLILPLLQMQLKPSAQQAAAAA
jgi:hypothetical protein